MQVTIAWNPSYVKKDGNRQPTTINHQIQKHNPSFSYILFPNSNDVYQYFINKNYITCPKLSFQKNFSLNCLKRNFSLLI